MNDEEDAVKTRTKNKMIVLEYRPLFSELISYIRRLISNYD